MSSSLLVSIPIIEAKNDAKTLKRRWIDHLKQQNPNSKNSRDNSHIEKQKPKFNP